MHALGIDNIVIDVTDLESAREFYGSILGLEEKYVIPDPGLVGIRIGDEEPGIVLRFTPAVEHSAGRGPRLWLEVEDAGRTAQELARSGVVPLDEPRRLRTGWMVEIHDPFGNVIGLVDYRFAPELARESRGRTER